MLPQSHKVLNSWVSLLERMISLEEHVVVVVEDKIDPTEVHAEEKVAAEVESWLLTTTTSQLFEQ